MQPEELKALLRQRITDECLVYYGDSNRKWIDYACDYFWDEATQDFRLDDLKAYCAVSRDSLILDVAAGCGQFFLRASDAGLICYGLEPESWKIDFIQQKIALTHRPAGLISRLVTGYGENLPWPDNHFDCLTSYQTLEHVQDPCRVLAEMVRVTKAGGALFIRCPDYRSTFEGHYHLPWLPLMPRTLARFYLQLLGKPTKGLEAIQYVTLPRIMAWLRQIESASGCRLEIIDAGRVAMAERLRQLGLACLVPLYPLYMSLKYTLNLFRREMSVNVVVRVIHKGQTCQTNRPLA